MCEKLFDHVGQFRAHATAHVKQIVDRMHDPTAKGVGNDKAQKGLIPLAMEDLTGPLGVLLDEDDSSLYFPSQNIGEHVGGASSLSSQMSDPFHQGPSPFLARSIYKLDNILFKLTNPNEVVYTLGNSGGEKPT